MGMRAIEVSTDTYPHVADGTARDKKVIHGGAFTHPTQETLPEPVRCPEDPICIPALLHINKRFPFFVNEYQYTLSNLDICIGNRLSTYDVFTSY